MSRGCWVVLYHGPTGATYGLELRGIPRRTPKAKVRAICKSLGLTPFVWVKSTLFTEEPVDVYYSRSSAREPPRPLAKWKRRRAADVLHHMQLVLMLLTRATPPRITLREIGEMVYEGGLMHELTHAVLGIRRMPRWFKEYGQRVAELEARLPEVFPR